MGGQKPRIGRYFLGTCFGEKPALRGEGVMEAGWGRFQELGVPIPPPSDLQVQIRPFPNGTGLCPLLTGAW